MNKEKLENEVKNSKSVEDLWKVYFRETVNPLLDLMEIPYGPVRNGAIETIKKAFFCGASSLFFLITGANLSEGPTDVTQKDVDFLHSIYMELVLFSKTL